ncbi:PLASMODESMATA CALLOSE-BINDING PROTEIN 2 isoform X2 [Brachypodium distachyon]|uniref:X8 domain-containing protein n=1 Tax=Brachypodium distachyon TaxID=15368 RepID=I1HG07_BRADI|nr:PLASMODESMATA CALLOSE-BINDING PROTEIN 2 isoform X2 [Brachypodium distachyon]PNT70656.1 hypothetical protein BRADI_2g15280v3 [Brachypodium distachyon]|eukprot:XP_014754271.1 PLASMODESMATA CALLOSE-BINDING PROTEIN 2 isoform X2 [Brachypodium distachyon]
MGLGAIQCLASVLALFLFCHGGRGIEVKDMPERDVTTPLVTVPVTNYPTATPAGTPLPAAVPSLAHPAAAAMAGSWCVANPSAGAAVLQVALDYACGPQGGADCSAIQPGGGCAIPDTVRDHASYAFNSYYQKNPVQTSCDFAGSAILTTTDPSTSSCKYPATSTGASILNTTNPLTPTFGSPPGPPGGYYNSPPGYGNSPPIYGSMSPPDYGGSINAAATAMPGPGGKKMTALLPLACFIVARVCLNLSL